MNAGSAAGAKVEHSGNGNAVRGRAARMRIAAPLRARVRAPRPQCCTLPRAAAAVTGALRPRAAASCRVREQDRLSLRLMAAGSPFERPVRSRRRRRGRRHRFLPFSPRGSSKPTSAISRGPVCVRVVWTTFDPSLVRRRSRGRRAAQCPLANPPIYTTNRVHAHARPSLIPSETHLYHLFTLCCELFCVHLG